MYYLFMDSEPPKGKGYFYQELDDDVEYSHIDLDYSVNIVPIFPTRGESLDYKQYQKKRFTRRSFVFFEKKFTYFVVPELIKNESHLRIDYCYDFNHGGNTKRTHLLTGLSNFRTIKGLGCIATIELGLLKRVFNPTPNEQSINHVSFDDLVREYLPESFNSYFVHEKGNVAVFHFDPNLRGEVDD